MTLVRNTIYDPSGTGIAGIPVQISLSDPGYLADGTIVGYKTTTTDASGVWSVDLPPGDSITPLGTHYRVQEASRLSLIEVPDSVDTLELTDLLVTAPADPDDLGVSSVDGLTGAVDLSDLYLGKAVDLTAWDDIVSVVDLADDPAEPDTSVWPDRLVLRFRGEVVQWWNEFFEQRLAPSSPAADGTGPSRVGWRLFAAITDTAYSARSAATPVWEIANYRTGGGNNTSLASIDHLGAMALAGDMTLTPAAWEPLVPAAGMQLGTPQGEVRLEGAYNTARMRGVIENDGSGTISGGTTLATVPAGHRPAQTVAQICRQVESGVTLTITSDGAITSSSSLGVGGYVRLDNFSWPLD